MNYPKRVMFSKELLYNINEECETKLQEKIYV